MTNFDTLADDSRMPSGKYKNYLMKDLSHDYLFFYYISNKNNEHSKSVIDYILSVPILKKRIDGINDKKLKSKRQVKNIIVAYPVRSGKPIFTCDKIAYVNQNEAKRELKNIREKSNSTISKKPVRTYKCDNCSFWHLSSKPLNNNKFEQERV